MMGEEQLVSPFATWARSPGLTKKLVPSKKGEPSAFSAPTQCNFLCVSLRRKLKILAVPTSELRLSIQECVEKLLFFNAFLVKVTSATRFT